MSKVNKTIAAVLYLLGMGITLWGLLKGKQSITAINLGVLTLLIPWIICLKQTLQMKPQRLLWFYVLFFFGVLSIPIFLLSTTPKNQPADGQNQV